MGLRTLSTRFQGQVEERFKDREFDKLLPLVGYGAGDAVSQITSSLLLPIANLGEGSFQSETSLLNALQSIADTGNGKVRLMPGGVFWLVFEKTVVDQVPMPDHLILGENLLLSSDDVLTLAVTLNMILSFGVTEDGDFFVDNVSDYFRLDLFVSQPVDFTGRLGFVDIAAPGSQASLSGAYIVDLKRDQDGRTTLAELGQIGFDALAEAALAGKAELKLPALSLRDALPGVSASTSIRWDDINIAWQLDVDTAELADKGFRRFRNVDATTFVNALSSVAQAFKDTRRHGLLNATLPLTQQSTADLVNAGQELEEEVTRLREELRRKDANDALVYRNPSASELASILSKLGLATDGAGLQITTEDIQYRLQFQKPVYGQSQPLPQVKLDLRVNSNEQLALTLDRPVALALTSAEVRYDLTVGVKIKDPADLALELGVNLMDADGDGGGLADPCGFDSLSCSPEDLVDPDADGDGLIDALEDEDDDGDRVRETVTKKENYTCDFLANFTGATCETLASMNNVPDKEAFDALPVGTLLKLDPVFRLPSPLTMEHRVFVRPGEGLVTLSSSISGSVGGGDYPTMAHLGFLDLSLKGDYSLSSTFTLGLTDTKTSADDGRVDLAEVAAARENGQVDTLLHISPQGEVDAHFTLNNALLDGASPGGAVRHLDMVGNLSALDNPGSPFPAIRVQPIRVAHSSSTEPEAGAMVVDPASVDAIYVGQDLKELLGFQNVTTKDVNRVLDYVGAWLDRLENDEVLGQQLPFIEDQVSQIVPWDHEFYGFRQLVRGEAPKDLTSYMRALERALKAVGAAGELGFQVTERDVRFSLPLVISGDKGLPLNLVVPKDGDRLLRTSDGAGDVQVSASFDFPLTMGLRFGGAEASFDQRGFVTESSGPTVTVSLGQTFDKTRAIFGPVAGTVTGAVGMPEGVLAVGLRDPNGDGYVTLAELLNVKGTALTHAVGPVTADLVLSLDGKEPSNVVVRGNLRAFENVRAGKPVYNKEITDPAIVGLINPDTADQIYLDPEVDLEGMLLDMEALVGGFRDYAQVFVDVTALLDIDLPIIGDALSEASNVAEDLIEIADFLEQLLRDVREDDQAFLNMIETRLEGFIQTDLGLPIDVTVSGGLEAQEVLVEFDYTVRLVSESLSLETGLDLEPAFKLDFKATGVLTVEFNAHIGVGVSIEDGFFVQGGRIMGVKARLALEDLNADANLLGFLNMRIKDGEVAVGGPGEIDGKPAVFLGAHLGEVTDEEPNPRITLIQLLQTDAPDAEDVQEDATCSSTGGQAEGCDAQGGGGGGDGGGDGAPPFKVGLELELTAELPIATQIAFEIEGTNIEFPSTVATLKFKWPFQKLFPEEQGGGGGDEDFPEMVRAAAAWSSPWMTSVLTSPICAASRSRRCRPSTPSTPWPLTRSSRY